MIGTLLKKETLVQVFSCEFCEIFKNTFFIAQLWTTASEMNSYIYIKLTHFKRVSINIQEAVQLEKERKSLINYV